MSKKAINTSKSTTKKKTITKPTVKKKTVAKPTVKKKGTANSTSNKQRIDIDRILEKIRYELNEYISKEERRIDFYQYDRNSNVKIRSEYINQHIQNVLMFCPDSAGEAPIRAENYSRAHSPQLWDDHGKEIRQCKIKIEQAKEELTIIGDNNNFNIFIKIPTQRIEDYYQHLLIMKTSLLNKNNKLDLILIASKFRWLEEYKESKKMVKECENKILDMRYNELINAMGKASEENDFHELARQFHELKGYKNSIELADKCDKKYRALMRDRRRQEREEAELERIQNEQQEKDRERCKLQKIEQQKQMEIEVRNQKVYNFFRGIGNIVAIVFIILFAVSFYKIYNICPDVKDDDIIFISMMVLFIILFLIIFNEKKIGIRIYFLVGTIGLCVFFYHNNQILCCHKVEILFATKGIVYNGGACLIAAIFPLQRTR